MNTVTLWHGGRGLEASYRDSPRCTSGRWEYGPGLYLTTHYDTAREYAKGGGKTYLVTVEEGVGLDEVDIPYSRAEEFVRRNVAAKLREQRLCDIERVMNRSERTKDARVVPASSLLNLMINGDALPAAKAHHLRELLVEHGAHYAISTRYKGRDESILVVFDASKIVSVKAVPAANVGLADYELPLEFAKPPSASNDAFDDSVEPRRLRLRP